MDKDIIIPITVKTDQELTSQEKLLIDKALEIAKGAYAPYSNFSVRLQARVIAYVRTLRGQVSVYKAVQAGLGKGAGGFQAVSHGLGQILGVEVCFHCLHVVFYLVGD